MKDTVINDRLTSQIMQAGLIRLLLMLIIATSSLPVFSASKSAPVISGTPATSVVVGSSYYFQPVTTDPGMKKLRPRFSISNQPAWAEFSRRTGLLSGTPGQASVGTYRNIVISVNDGAASASLPAFSIEVQQVAPDQTDTPAQNGTPDQTGSLTLQWTAPVTRTDGTPLSLSDIDGYYIYYGETAGNYPNRIDLDDGTVQTVTITDIPAGSYYLVMTTYDVSGIESAYSSMVNRIVQ